MTKVKIGTIVETEFGVGPVVCITKSWLIHENKDGDEVCVFKADHYISIPADTDDVDIDQNAEMEIA